MTIPLILTLFGMAYLNGVILNLTGKNLLLSAISANKNIISILLIVVFVAVLLIKKRKRK